MTQQLQERKFYSQPVKAVDEYDFVPNHNKVFCIKTQTLKYNQSIGSLTERLNNYAFLRPGSNGRMDVFVIMNKGYNESPSDSVFYTSYIDDDVDDHLGLFNALCTGAAYGSTGGAGKTLRHRQARLEKNFNMVTEALTIQSIYTHLTPASKKKLKDQTDFIGIPSRKDIRAIYPFMSDYDGKRNFQKTDTVYLVSELGWFERSGLSKALDYNSLKAHCDSLDDDSIRYTWYGQGSHTPRIREAYKRGFQAFFGVVGAPTQREVTRMQEKVQISRLKDKLSNKIAKQAEKEVAVVQAEDWGLFG